MNVNSIDELVAMARAQPGKLNAAAANGISDFLLFGFFKSMGLQIVRVPYRDIMQAPSDLAQSRIQVLSTSLAVVQPLSKAGRIKVLAVTSRQRAPSAPDVPTAIPVKSCRSSGLLNSALACKSSATSSPSSPRHWGSRRRNRTAFRDYAQGHTMWEKGLRFSVG
jgi:hypothetical protein